MPDLHMLQSPLSCCDCLCLVAMPLSSQNCSGLATKAATSSHNNTCHFVPSCLNICHLLHPTAIAEAILHLLPHHCTCRHLVAIAATVLKSPPPFCDCHHCCANALTFLVSPPWCCNYHNLFEIATTFSQPPPPCFNH